MSFHVVHQFICFPTECKTRYHVNNYIHNSQRIYYHGVPDVLQVAQHFFIEAALLELFVAGQVFGW